MVALIPYQKIEIKTRLSQEAAGDRLQEIVEPRKLRWGWSRDHLPFQGTVDGNTFKISRIIYYRNNFLPILVGEIRDDLDASTLQISVRPNLLVMVVWSLMGLIFVGAALYSAELSFLWTILPLFLFFYGLPTAIFNWELNKAVSLLNKHFETDKFSLP